MKIIESEGEEETGAAAAALAHKAAPGAVYLLSGPLGAGKSVFARAFIRTLCPNAGEVPSPTFTLVQIYDTDKGPLYHFDLYRITHPDDIFELGWEDALSSIALVEWPDRLGPYTPPGAVRIDIAPLNTHTRKITFHDAQT